MATKIKLTLSHEAASMVRMLYMDGALVDAGVVLITQPPEIVEIEYWKQVEAGLRPVAILPNRSRRRKPT